MSSMSFSLDLRASSWFFAWFSASLDRSFLILSSSAILPVYSATMSVVSADTPSSVMRFSSFISDDCNEIVCEASSSLACKLSSSCAWLATTFLSDLLPLLSPTTSASESESSSWVPAKVATI